MKDNLAEGCPAELQEERRGASRSADIQNALYGLTKGFFYMRLIFYMYILYHPYRCHENMHMHYVYIFRLKNGQHYIGYTTDIDDRLGRHLCGKACATTQRVPVDSLEFYAAFRTEERARSFETYLKSSSGFAFRNKRLI